MLNHQKKIKWLISSGLVEYPTALSAMEKLYEKVLSGDKTEYIWLLEHPPLWTAGVSAKDSEILSADLPVYKAKRGGKMTYHGPGQRVVYLILDLRAHGKDVRGFVQRLESWISATLAHFEIDAKPDQKNIGKNIGLWVGEEKIAAIGIRLRHWISTHGIAVNINPNLAHYQGIIPCGIADKGITSLAACGKDVSMAAFDAALRASFLTLFQIPSANLQSQHFDPHHIEFS